MVLLASLWTLERWQNDPFSEDKIKTTRGKNTVTDNKFTFIIIFLLFSRPRVAYPLTANF